MLTPSRDEQDPPEDKDFKARNAKAFGHGDEVKAYRVALLELAEWKARRDAERATG